MDQEVNGKYPVAVAMDKSAMRGLDYRSETAKMSLVIAASFENMREAMQGYHRVGRFGDPCQRVSFKDVPLINAKEQSAYKLRAFRFITAMEQKPVSMKQPTIKGIKMPAAAKPTAARFPGYKSKLGQKRIEGLGIYETDKTMQTTIKFGGTADKNEGQQQQ
jgi:hypothetical protein